MVRSRRVSRDGPIRRSGIPADIPTFPRRSWTNHRSDRFCSRPAPFWSLVRMMFPVAESLGDLIYRRDNATAQNLRAVLENDFEEVRTGYRGKSALLALLYRHSLTQSRRTPSGFEWR